MQLGELSAAGPVPFESPLIYNPRRRYEAWRYLTYMFIHAGYSNNLFDIKLNAEL